MAAAPAGNAPTVAKATVAERAAAERLGSVYLYLAGLRGLPLDTWAIPEKERAGQLHAPFYAALGEIYVSDDERDRALGRSKYVNRYVLYKKDYDTIMPRVG